MTFGHQSPSERHEQYTAGLRRATPRLLGMMDRGPDSITAGSLDRDHWAWKMRDGPIGMLQMGLVPLAKLATASDGASVLPAVGRLPEWIELGVRETLSRQHTNGAFDSVGPFTQDHGMTLAAAWLLATVGHRLDSELPGSLPESLVASMRSAVQRACDFGLKSDEDYAFISNHQALFALAFHEAARFVQNDDLAAHADRLVAEIIEKQSPDGWYQEYNGPDPGYETLGLHYLAELLDEREPTGLRASLKKSVSYLTHFVHPDGSLGGVYGSRHTHLWVPGGLERLATWMPEAEAIVARVAHHLPNGSAVTLDSVDHHNLPPLMGGWVSAWLTTSDASDRARAELPVDADRFDRHFEDAGTTVVVRPSYQAIVAGRKGGVGVVYGRESRRRLFHDAGYRAETSGKAWTTQALGGSTPTAELAGEVPSLRIDARFEAARQQLVTPWNHLILRVLNLTFFRSVRLGALLRGMIVKRMITGRAEGPLRLERHITYGETGVSFVDSIHNEGSSRATRLRHCTSFLAFHMGSARYFTSGEVSSGGHPDLPQAATLAPGESMTVHFEVDASGPSQSPSPES